MRERALILLSISASMFLYHTVHEVREGMGYSMIAIAGSLWLLLRSYK